MRDYQGGRPIGKALVFINEMQFWGPFALYSASGWDDWAHLSALHGTIILLKSWVVYLQIALDTQETYNSLLYELLFMSLVTFNTSHR